jgi:hypothetical protein
MHLLAISAACTLAVISGGCSSSLPHQRPEKAAEPFSATSPLSVYVDALASDFKWQEDVPADEIRTSWFHQGDPRVAFICCTNLSTQKSTSCRDVYNWARQGEQVHDLTDDQVATLRRWLKGLPPSDGLPELNDLFVLSAVVDGRKIIYTYSISRIPADVVALCGLTAAYLDLPRAK